MKLQSEGSCTSEAVHGEELKVFEPDFEGWGRAVEREIWNCIIMVMRP